MAVAVASRVSEVLRRLLDFLLLNLVVVVVVDEAVEPVDEVREVAAADGLLSVDISLTTCNIDPDVILHIKCKCAGAIKVSLTISLSP